MDLRLALTHLMLYYVAQLRRDSGLPGLRPWLDYEVAVAVPDVAVLRASNDQALLRYSSHLAVDATDSQAAEALLDTGHAMQVWDLIRSSIINPEIPASREWRLRFPREVAAFEILRAHAPSARKIHVQGDEVFYSGNGADTQPLRFTRGVTLTGDPAHG